MVLLGSLKLIIGLAFLGFVIALCLWLLSKLFPDTPPDTQGKKTSEDFQEHMVAQNNPQVKKSTGDHHHIDPSIDRRYGYGDEKTNDKGANRR